MWPVSTKEFWLRESVQMASPLIKTLPKQLCRWIKLKLVVHQTKNINWHCQYAALRLSLLLHSTFSLVFMTCSFEFDIYF